MKTAYGIDVVEENDSYIETAEHALSSISATINAGSYLVDSLPLRKSNLDSHRHADVNLLPS